MNRQNKLSAFAILFFFWLISAPAFAASEQYTYDNLNRITSVEYDNGMVIEYTYDDVGNRTGKKVVLGNICEGDFDADNDVDGSDIAVFAADLGRTDCP